MEWTDAAIEKLRELWAQGMSAKDIGSRLNTSKHAIVGKVHRLNLPGRPSPIRRGGEPKKAAVPRSDIEKVLPKLKAVPDAAPAGPAPEPVVRRRGPSGPCWWPIGEPGRPSFHWCGADSEIGRPYCEEHSAIAYVRVRDRREDVA